MHNDEFRTRMRNHPLAPKRPATVVISQPDQPAHGTAEANATAHDVAMTQPRQPAFTVPLQTDMNALPTLDDLVALSKGGDEVPMPVAREVTLKEREAVLAGQSPSARMTPLERDTLTRLGWREGEPVPPDFAAELQAVFTDYVARKQAEGVDPSKIPMRNIEDLPPEEQAGLRESLRNMITGVQRSTASQTTAQSSASGLAALSAYPDSVRNALAGVDLSPIDSKAEPEPIKSPDKSPIPLPLEATPEPLPQPVSTPSVCNTCGYNPKDEKKRLSCSHCGGDPLDDAAQEARKKYQFGTEMERLANADLAEMTKVRDNKAEGSKEWKRLDDLIQKKEASLAEATKLKETSLHALASQRANIRFVEEQAKPIKQGVAEANRMTVSDPDILKKMHAGDQWQSFHHGRRQRRVRT